MTRTHYWWDKQSQREVPAGCFHLWNAHLYPDGPAEAVCVYCGMKGSEAGEPRA